METQAPYLVSDAEQPTALTIFGPDVWAIVEIMGHQRVAGRIRKEGFGNSELLVVETPELPAYRLPDEPWETKVWNIDKQWFDTEVGRKVYNETPAVPRRISACPLQSIVIINLCTENEAREELGDTQDTPKFEIVIDKRFYDGTYPDENEDTVFDPRRQHVAYGPEYSPAEAEKE